jgi:hypothetical protein
MYERKKKTKNWLLKIHWYFPYVYFKLSAIQN